MAIGFPISRDPPEGGTGRSAGLQRNEVMFPISRDPPEGGTASILNKIPADVYRYVSNF